MGLEEQFERDGRCAYCCGDVHTDANGVYEFGPRICSKDCEEALSDEGGEYLD